MTDLSDTLAALSAAATNPREPSNAWDDFAFACAHAYRTGQLVPVPSVERVALQPIEIARYRVCVEIAKGRGGTYLIPGYLRGDLDDSEAIIAAMQEAKL